MAQHGKGYEVGTAYRGVWGICGGYDYISPHIFRVSRTSLSLGTTFQWWLAREVALQGSVLGGVGYAAAGNVTQVEERDYHLGIAPQGLIGLRLIFGERAMLAPSASCMHYSAAPGSAPSNGVMPIVVDPDRPAREVLFWRRHGATEHDPQGGSS